MVQARFSQGFSEIVLIVEDVSKSAAFYRDVVGLAVSEVETEDWAWFWAGSPDSTQRLGLHRGTLLFEEHSPYPAGQRFGRIHYAFHVPRAALDSAVAHVRAHGVEVYGPTHFAWMAALSYYFYDPDGHLLEWWSPDPAETTS